MRYCSRFDPSAPPQAALLHISTVDPSTPKNAP